MQDDAELVHANLTLRIHLLSR